MIVAILFLELLTIFLIVVKSCFRKKYVAVNHVFCISLGYLYYGLLPIMCYELNIVFDDFLYKSLLRKYGLITETNKYKFLLIAFLMYLAFILGSRIKPKKEVICELKDTRFLISEQILVVIILLMGCFVTWLNRNFLLKGYNVVKNFNKGIMSAYVLMVASFFLMYLLSTKKRKGLKDLFVNRWGVIYLFFAALLLSMGGRIYVVTSIFAIIICYTVFLKNEIPWSKFAGMLLLIVFLAGVWGRVRQGVSLDIKSIFFNVLQEPIYTSYSLITYLENNEIVIGFAFPRILLSGMINLIPSMAFPNKVEYMVDVFDVGEGIKSPLGATHYFTSFALDFGGGERLLLLEYWGGL